LDLDDSINYTSGSGWKYDQGKYVFVAYPTTDRETRVANFDSYHDLRGNHCSITVGALYNGDVPTQVQAQTYRGKIGWKLLQ